MLQKENYLIIVMRESEKGTMMVKLTVKSSDSKYEKNPQNNLEALLNTHQSHLKYVQDVFCQIKSM